MALKNFYADSAKRAEYATLCKIERSFYSSDIDTVSLSVCYERVCSRDLEHVKNLLDTLKL